MRSRISFVEPALDHLAHCEPARWHSFIDTAVSKGHLKRIAGASVRVVLLDAQRFGEWDAPHPRPEPNLALLLPKKLKQYQKPPPCKTISTLVPASMVFLSFTK